MLARTETKPIAAYLPVPEVVSEQVLFPWWCAVVVKASRERKIADWMDEKLGITPYWPHFTRQIRYRGRMHVPSLSAVVPGLLFVPEAFLHHARRDEILDFIRSHGFLKTTDGDIARLSKGQIETIRVIEAKLNLPPERKGVLFKIGQKVEFTDPLIGYSWGTGVVVEIASPTRIGVEVKKLFGRTTKVYVPASEIEAM